MDGLRARWKYLYAEYLPALAKAKDSAQPKWPVYLDHCFARILLDNAVGKDKPWTESIKSPAIYHMTEDQFAAAISLAEAVASGDADLVELDERSLQSRGKQSKQTGKRKADAGGSGAKAIKKQKVDKTVSSYFLPSPSSSSFSERDNGVPDAVCADGADASVTSKTYDPVDIAVQLKRIKDSNLTPFRKETLSLLCGVPRGRYSTYQAMSDHISKTSHKTCARAVGSAMRNNPFAPEVPCHRILAADGSLGGFKGHWGEQGQFAGKKHELLKEEGVRFDSNGKVKGPVFKEWT